MRYVMKQKFFKLKEDFYIKNDMGEECYFVDDHFFTFGRQCEIYDTNQQLLYKVREKLLTFLSNFVVYDVNDLEVATIQQNFSFFTANYTVTSSLGNIDVQGNFFDYNFKIYLNNRLIGNITRELFSFSDHYYIDVDYEDEALVLAIVIAIDSIMDKRKN